ncbi:MAG: ABC transporter [Ornithinimicrobium sp.]|uniref:ABC transporter n=1 Tax=Ornithinimicrobium sp. TaxID=1977084 RepID=UPI0026E0A131|nr:ABC transporter [Ornithinimicrobium sp.]MDO5740200.1 ABC transporter [Ornithinimicrobium sp.]
MNAQSGRAATAPGMVAITLVAGTGMAAVVATSLGLMPLYGEPQPSLEGWRTAAPDLLLGVRESLLIALPATLLAAVVGLLLAGLLLGGGPTASWVRLGCLAVLAVPHLVGATSMGQLLGDGGLAARVAAPGLNSWPPLVAGPWPIATVLELAWKESAFVALVVFASLAPGHRQRMEVAAGLGASPLQRLTRVGLPAALPAIGASSLVTLVYAIGSYEVAWLLGRTAPEPLPVLAFRLFGSIELTDRPAAAAAAVTGAVLAIGIAGPILAALPHLRSVLSLPTRTTR